jgi:hypothetical protein
MDLEMKAYEYDNATGDWSHLCSTLNASFRLGKGSAMLQIAPQREAQKSILLGVDASAMMHGDPMSSEGDEDDEDNADSDDAAAMSRRIARQSEKLLRLLQGAPSTQLSEPALAGLMALTDVRTSTIEAAQASPVESSTFDGTSASISW